MLVLAYFTTVVIFTAYPSDVNGLGAILSLPPPTTTSTPPPKTKGKAVELPIIHTWQNCKEGYHLEVRVSSTPNQFTVKVSYEGAVIEILEADRFDGDLTLSVKMKSYNDALHIVEYLLADKTCKRRSYVATKDKKGVEKKTDEDCEFPSESGGLGSTTYRKNCWIWKDSLLEGWGKGPYGTWGGAVQELPAIGAPKDPSFDKGLKLHKWNNVVPDYHMTVYRASKDKPEDQHLVAMWYKDTLIQDGVKVNRFDDDLLNSITVVQSQQPNQHNIAYKHHDGSCKHRSYTMTGPKPQVTEKSCFHFTIYKVLNYVLHTTAVNGWTW